MKAKIEHAIFEGLKESYEDNYSFTGEISSIVKPESLIHINIAKKIRVINDENNDWGRPLQIKLEEPTSVFSTACVPFDAYPDDIFSSVLRENHNTCRNGNIDIALYTEGETIFDNLPYAAIEIKDFISSRGELKLDIIRNIEYLTINDKNTGASRLKQTYLVCVHEHKGAIIKSDKQKELIRLEKGYKKYLAKFGLNAKKIKLRLKIDTIAEYLIGANDKYLPSDIMEDKAAQAIHFIGVVIVFEK